MQSCSDRRLPSGYYLARLIFDKEGIEETKKFFEGHFSAVKNYIDIMRRWVEVEDLYTSSLDSIIEDLDQLEEDSLK